MSKITAPCCDYPILPVPSLCNNPAADHKDCQLARPAECIINTLPSELLCTHVLTRLEARSLAKLDATCSFFCAGKPCLTEQAACQKLTASLGSAEASRFTGVGWKQRLRTEEYLAGFDPTLLQRAGFTAVSNPNGRISSVSLPHRLGPKLLVSDWGTFDKPILRWRLRIRGNMAVEFGVVPLSMVLNPTALHQDVLHRDLPNRKGGMPLGFCSLTTEGSTLPFKAQVTEGCVVEVIAHTDHVQYIISNPQEASDKAGSHQHDGVAAPGSNTFLLHPSRVPKQMRLQHSISPDCDYRLALTAWANGRFEVIPSFTPAEQPAADVSSHKSSTVA